MEVGVPHPVYLTIANQKNMFNLTKLSHINIPKQEYLENPSSAHVWLSPRERESFPKKACCDITIIENYLGMW
jgi:hypothetical protein